MNQAKIVVVGAGIVGLATALKLREQFPNGTITVVERNSRVFSETSRYNSGVVHSGIHQQSSLLKSQLAPRGGKLLIDFCEKHGVVHSKPGMLIAAASRDFPSLISELTSLFRLRQNSRRLNLSLKFLTQRGVHKLEPNIRAAIGLYLPDVWTIDQDSLSQKLFAFCLAQRVEFAFGTSVESVTRCRDQFELYSTNGKSKDLIVHTADILVNAAGVNSAIISTLVGFPGYQIYPTRGEYYEVVGEKRNLLKKVLVYPALPPGHPVKGIHLTKKSDGRLLLGPNATNWKSNRDDFNAQTPPGEFLEAAKRFLPQLELSDLRWAYSGLRAKTKFGSGENDFLIQTESKNPTFVNLIGIESPGFTAGFAIAEKVAEQLRERI